MSFVLAITGKGGVGKTTLAGLVVLRLVSRGFSPVLAVDADPNMCLGKALGVTVKRTVGALREEARQFAEQGMISGLSKREFLEMKIAESLVEARDFDLVAMGRPEGPGCYCYANNVLKGVLGHLSSAYPCVVIDNEAGLENLSRRLVQKPDLLILVTDPSSMGFETVLTLHGMAREMKISYARLAIVINRLRGDLPSRALEIKNQTEADAIVGIPFDEVVYLLSEAGQSLALLPEGNSLVTRVDGFLDDLSLTGKKAGVKTHVKVLGSG